MLGTVGIHSFGNWIEAMTAKQNNQIHLLMVDEHSFSSVLDHEGYRHVGIVAHLASSIDELESVIHKRQIDVALINWENPKLDPLAVVRFVRSNQRSKDVPIVATSVHTIDDKTLQNPEIDLFVKQPIPRILLLERIRQLLQRDLRKDERFEVHDFYLDTVKIHVQGEVRDLKLADISLSGIFLYSNILFHKGDSLEIEFVLPGTKEHVRAVGEVTRVTRMHKNNDKMSNGVGVRFVEFRQGSKEALASYFEKNKPESDFIFYYL